MPLRIEQTVPCAKAAFTAYPPGQVRFIAALNHRSLVRLLGFCVHMEIATSRQEQILVYEFVGNGDLDRHIKRGDCELVEAVSRMFFERQRNGEALNVFHCHCALALVLSPPSCCTLAQTQCMLTCSLPAPPPPPSPQYPSSRWCNWPWAQQRALPICMGSLSPSFTAM